MPYVARRLMKHGDGVLDDGDVIDDFEEWPATTRSYLLEKGDVEYRSGEDTVSARAAEPSAETVEVASEGAATSDATSPSRAPRKAVARKPAPRKTTTRKSTAGTKKKGGAP